MTDLRVHGVFADVIIKNWPDLRTHAVFADVIVGRKRKNWWPTTAGSRIPKIAHGIGSSLNASISSQEIMHRIVAVGQGGGSYSNNGTTWTNYTSPNTVSDRGIIWDGEKFHMSGFSGDYAYTIDTTELGDSPTGWTGDFDLGDSTTNVLLYVPEYEMIFAGTEGSEVKGVAKADFATPANWDVLLDTEPLSGPSNGDGGYVRGLAYSPTEDVLVATMLDGVIWSAPGPTFTSWTLRTTDVSHGSYNMNAAIWCSGFDLFLAGGEGGHIRHSSDATSWTDTVISEFLNDDIWAMCYSPELDRAVVAGDGGVIVYSDNGTTWNNASDNAAITWDISTATYDSSSFSIASQDTLPSDVAFSSDGTKMYMLGYNNQTIYQYSLSTAWHVNTASYGSVSYLINQDSGNTGLYFKPDGTKLYVIGSSGNNVYQHTLGTAWDLSTASYDSVSFSIAGEDGLAQGVTFKPDGTKMYMTGGINNTIFQYTLSTAWDISTASYDSISFNIASQEVGPTGTSFKSDGTRMWLIGNTDTIFQYDLSTPWDLSSAAYNSVSKNFTSQDTNPHGLFVRDDGTKLYIIGTTNDTVYQYSIGATVSGIIWSNTAQKFIACVSKNPDGGSIIESSDGSNWTEIYSGATDQLNALAVAEYTTPIVIPPEVPGEPPSTILGEPDDGEVEPRLLTDPHVLLVITHESTDWKTKFGTGTDTHLANQTVTSTGTPSGTAGKALRIKTPAGELNGYGAHRNFALAGLADLEEAYFRYRVNFSQHTFMNSTGDGGGKLPGLAGKAGTMPTYDSKVGSGGQRYNGSTQLTTSNYLTADGWSARLLWQKDRGLSSYLYVPDPSHIGDVKSGGSYFGWSNRVKTSVGGSTNALFHATNWNDVEVRIKLNTISGSTINADGIYEVWLNGVKGLSMSNIIFRRSANVKITQVYDACTFGGGSGDAPDSDDYVWFDDYVIGNGYIGPKT
jgi:sugar lactone lactonase YvrE